MLALLLAPIMVAATGAHGKTYDLLVKNGTVVDGSGRPAYEADIGIRAGKIAFIGKAGPDVTARSVADAKGLIVAPGFIDAHNHVLDQAEKAEVAVLNEPYIRQGVTTIVGGADGGASPSEMNAAVKRVEKVGITSNYAFYVGHNGIRREVMGSAQRAPSADELARMRGLVRQGMEMGAVGFSTGLMYSPGMYSRTDEVIALTKEIKPFGGIYDSHTRDPVFHFIESDEEAISIGREAGVPVKIAHEKAAGIANKGKMKDAIALIEAARAAGQAVYTDQYPYDGAMVSPLETWFVVPGVTDKSPGAHQAVRDAVARARNEPEFASALQAASEKGEHGGFSWIKAVGYGSMRIVDSADFPELVGQNVELLARARGVPPFTLISDLLASSRAPILIAGSVEESEVRELLVKPWNMIASDGGVVSASTTTSLHPRSTGTFARVLGRYSRELGLLSLPEAVRKMTSLPARILGLNDRGTIAIGKAADIVMFDAQEISDQSSWSQPDKLATGVVNVVVNGVQVLHQGRLTGNTPGRWIKHDKPHGS